MIEKLKLLKILKDSFKKDEIEDAFDLVLKEYLQEMNPTDIPDNLTSFITQIFKLKIIKLIKR